MQQIDRANFRPPVPDLQPQRAADILAREIPYQEAVDFAHGCEVLAAVITKEQPDIVFFPQRGAGPISWTTEAFLEDSGRKVPRFVDLPLGTHIRVNDANPRYSGISGSEKQELVEQMIASLQEEGVYVPGESRLMLVDEVQKGGTISQAAQSLRSAMNRLGDERNLSVVAAQDSRHNLLGEARKTGYRQLAANERKGFSTTVIPVSLFMVDRPQFLDEIWKTSDTSVPTLDDYITNENPRARRIFDALARVHLNPDQAIDEIEELRRHILAPDLGGTILQQEILEAMTDPNPVKGNKQATETHLLDWWTHYARATQRTLDYSVQPATLDS